MVSAWEGVEQGMQRFPPCHAPSYMKANRGRGLPRIAMTALYPRSRCLGRQLFLTNRPHTLPLTTPLTASCLRLRPADVDGGRR